MDQTKEYTDKGYNNKSSSGTASGLSDQASPVRCSASSPTWGINFTLLGNPLATLPLRAARGRGYNGIYGDWRQCEGPLSPTTGGGTRSAAQPAATTLRPSRTLVLKLTCDEAIMKQITMDTQDYTNNEKAMNEIASSDYKSDWCQNHIVCLQRLQPRSICPTPARNDQGLNESFRTLRAITSPATWEEDAAKANFSRPPSRRSTPS